MGSVIVYEDGRIRLRLRLGGQLPKGKMVLSEVFLKDESVLITVRPRTLIKAGSHLHGDCDCPDRSVT